MLAHGYLLSSHLLAHVRSFSWCRHREKVFAFYFDQENYLMYCTDPKRLVEKFGICHNHEEWKIFFDSSKRNLIAVLLHTSSKYASILVGYSLIMKES